ncbi:unnamed protein product [Soboliphyme baturini]|uniref:SMC_N domain-containing protein n=1 Tax=Soboliphyme baturini TaxID=241478 RepID=A0A183IIJ8_9BILA|nr:unnamed protein product [Soboliphyme baturini]
MLGDALSKPKPKVTGNMQSGLIVVETLLSMEVPPPPQSIADFLGTGSRLCIMQIVMENFKSYYGRHVLGPFHKNFTCIVGPNGSGKSNVIDSLLFVFGFRAQKIRCKNMRVLIHNSDGHQDVDFCSVEVHFALINDTIVQDSEFVVARTIDKRNNSRYLLNNNVVQFKDLSAWLRRNGIDLDHNRFLILQGEVEEIALMKPKALTEGDEGMLEYLEDIIGSSRLKVFIDKLDEKLEQLNDVCTTKVRMHLFSCNLLCSVYSSSHKQTYDIVQWTTLHILDLDDLEDRQQDGHQINIVTVFFMPSLNVVSFFLHCNRITIEFLILSQLCY